jgi:hypothetical protein
MPMSSDESTNKVVVFLNGKKETFLLKEKEFGSGSKGFNANGKFSDESGKRYQLSANIVEIGTKPKKEEKGKKP